MRLAVRRLPNGLESGIYRRPFRYRAEGDGMPERDSQYFEAGARQLCFHGVLLLALGLLSGFSVPFVATPRIGLSAHLAGVQSGMLLVILGLLWPRLLF